VADNDASLKGAGVLVDRLGFTSGTTISGLSRHSGLEHRISMPLTRPESPRFIERN
jgi:hypothetical protein